MERSQAGPFKVHWGAVLSGAFFGVGAWMFFLTLGTAIGARSLGTWTAIYTLVAPILGLFCGGLVAARSRGLETRADGALHGAVVWGLAMVLGAILIASFGAAVGGGGLAAALNRELPKGYMWAVAGSILGSLIASVIGASTVSSRAEDRERAVSPTMRRGEVHT